MPRRSRLRPVRIVLWGALLVVLSVAAFTGWLLLPWRHVRGLRVEAARVVPIGGTIGDGRGIVVDFSTDERLADVLQRHGAGFVTARLAVCGQEEPSRREVIVQQAGILPDAGRVRPLPSQNGRERFRATFPNSLGATVNRQTAFTPALGQPLCFTLEGGGMFMGRITAETIALPALR